ncbi:60s ribosomal protein l29 [Bipolaris maydis]|nr:60s ribosomal protein l29 [Bipolaris maydis]
MCGCTLYDSPTCGHSWLSMSQPCGFLSDFLNCPYRQTYQTLIAPPYTCPTCNGGFADQETIEMVQGPWGCNQLLRNHVGGNHAIPGQWGNVQLALSGPRSAAISCVATAGSATHLDNMTQNFTHDHRFTGPDGPAIIPNKPRYYDNGYYVNGRRKRSRHKSHYKYKYTDKPATNCAVIIKKPKTHRYPSLKGTDPKFRRNHRHALHGTMRALKEVKEGKRESA